MFASFFKQIANKNPLLRVSPGRFSNVIENGSDQVDGVPPVVAYSYVFVLNCVRIVKKLFCKC